MSEASAPVSRNDVPDSSDDDVIFLGWRKPNLRARIEMDIRRDEREKSSNNRTYGYCPADKSVAFTDGAIEHTDGVMLHNDGMKGHSDVVQGRTDVAKWTKNGAQGHPHGPKGHLDETQGFIDGAK